MIDLLIKLGKEKKNCIRDFSLIIFLPSKPNLFFYTLYFLFFVLPEGPVVKNVSLLMPEMFVAGSARASVSVLGERPAGNASILLKTELSGPFAITFI